MYRKYCLDVILCCNDFGVFVKSRLKTHAILCLFSPLRQGDNNYKSGFKHAVISAPFVHSTLPKTHTHTHTESSVCCAVITHIYTHCFFGAYLRGFSNLMLFTLSSSPLFNNRYTQLNLLQLSTFPIISLTIMRLFFVYSFNLLFNVKNFATLTLCMSVVVLHLAPFQHVAVAFSLLDSVLRISNKYERQCVRYHKIH